MSWFSAIMKTTAARLSALYLLLFFVGSVVIILYMTTLSASLLEGQTRQALNEEVINIGKTYNRGGIPALVRSIDYRSRQPGAYLYLVADVTGRILAGNVESIEPGVLDTDGFVERSFLYNRYGDQLTERQHRAIAVVIALPNGMRVMVGRDLSDSDRIRDIIQRSLMLALAIMGIGAVLIWFFVGRQALKRIGDVSTASQRIMDGDLSGRLPVNGSGDEFDRLSGNLNIMLARIQELNEGLKHVSDNIAHDLKTPLTRLRNRAEAALSGKKKTQDYREALESIIVESDQLILTFNAILMISRLEAGFSAENLAVQPVAPILRDVVEMYEPVAEDAGVHLELDDLSEAPIRFNRELIAQTISNLVDNAIKYASSDEKPAKVHVGMDVDDKLLRIFVADNGPGIAADMREKVTERFVRLEESRTQPGSGLGLSLAKAVMKLHGGSLTLEDNVLSEGEGGLRVVLEFPRHSES
ncbi:HAMP domain-containing sensor histidine kinase [Paenochrobactrum glaciei]|uniref:histidine kinase n=1 Tax=Paenochrobactrum glaciei TaxID=486407 RepID=A0ABN1FIZ9_9HYPH